VQLAIQKLLRPPGHVVWDVKELHSVSFKVGAEALPPPKIGPAEAGDVELDVEVGTGGRGRADEVDTGYPITVSFEADIAVAQVRLSRRPASSSPSRHLVSSHHIIISSRDHHHHHHHHRDGTASRTAAALLETARRRRRCRCPHSHLSAHLICRTKPHLISPPHLISSHPTLSPHRIPTPQLTCRRARSPTSWRASSARPGSQLPWRASRSTHTARRRAAG
jgi:hypothetical protein